MGGIQGDYDWINAGFERNSVFFYAMTSLRAKSVASLTGRIGYSWDRFLGHVKFGGAWERDELTLNFFNGFVATASDTRIGWTIGIGAECALHARARLARPYQPIPCPSLWSAPRQTWSCGCSALASFR